MLLQAEMLLMAMAISLYLYDSALLLYVNEGIVSPAGPGRWLVRFGSRRVRLLNKELFIPHPLLPHRPLFRLDWRCPSKASAGPCDWAAMRTALKPLAPMVWAMAFALFLLLPLGLFTRLGDPLAIAALLVLYLNMLAALAWLWLKRGALGIAGKRLALLSFESLVCCPLGLNIVRKISLELRVDQDLVIAARRLQTAEEWNATRAELIARLDEEMGDEADDPARLAVLRLSRQQLVEGEASCPA
jgi:hypothetical protein